MNKLSFILYIVYFLAIYAFLPTVQASESSPSPDSSFINSIEADITGDGLREYIRLEGKLLSHDSNYYHDTWLDITSPFSKSWNITLKRGYEPEISLLDLDHDQVLDIFYEVATNEEKTTYASQLYTWKDGSVEQVSLPQKTYIEGKYIDNFQIALTIEPNGTPIKIKIPNQSLAIKQQLYDKNGKVIENATVQIEPIHQYKPILISESKGHGLKTQQRVKDITENNTIGYVETLWYMSKAKWIILQKRWQSAP